MPGNASQVDPRALRPNGFTWRILSCRNERVADTHIYASHDILTRSSANPAVFPRRLQQPRHTSGRKPRAAGADLNLAQADQNVALYPLLAENCTCDPPRQFHMLRRPRQALAANTLD